MKILMLTSEFAPFRGGIGTYVMEMARAAAERGDDVTVAAPDYHEDQSDIDAHLPFRVIRYSDGTPTTQSIFSNIGWTRALATRETFDVVHAMDGTFYLAVRFSLYARTTRCILTFHGSEIAMMRCYSRHLFYQALNFWNGWAECIANSRFTADHLLANFPTLDPVYVKAIPLGVRAPDGLGSIGRDDARKQLGLSRDEKAIVSLGRVVERKGLHVTAEALRALPQSVQRGITWYVVGDAIDPVYDGQVRALAAQLSVKTVFTGGAPDDFVERALTASDLFCLPAVQGRSGEIEGFGLVYLEAALRGVTSIGTKLGGIPDAIIDGKTGLLVPPADARSLANAIDDLISSPEKAATLGEQARIHAQSSTWDKVAMQTYA